MEKAILIEKLSDIQSRINLVRNSVYITELDFIYQDLRDILEDIE